MRCLGELNKKSTNMNHKNQIVDIKSSGSFATLNVAKSQLSLTFFSNQKKRTFQVQVPSAALQNLEDGSLGPSHRRKELG